MSNFMALALGGIVFAALAALLFMPSAVDKGRIKEALAKKTKKSAPGDEPEKKTPTGILSALDLKEGGLTKEQQEKMGALVQFSQMFARETDRQRLVNAGYRGADSVPKLHLMRLFGVVGGGTMGLILFLLLGSGFSILWIIIIAAFAYGGFVFSDLALNQAIKNRQKEIGSVWSDAVDLLLIAVEAGIAPEPAFRRVTAELRKISPTLAEEFELTAAELGTLSDRSAAFRNLATRTGVPSVQQFASTLNQAERYGTSVGQALRLLAQEGRIARLNAAEEKAATIGTKITLVIMVFIFPVLLLLIGGAIALQSMAALS
jgi:tight adherence protein C